MNSAFKIIGTHSFGLCENCQVGESVKHNIMGCQRKQQMMEDVGSAMNWILIIYSDPHSVYDVVITGFQSPLKPRRGE